MCRKILSSSLQISKHGGPVEWEPSPPRQDVAPVTSVPWWEGLSLLRKSLLKALSTGTEDFLLPLKSSCFRGHLGSSFG